MLPKTEETLKKFRSLNQKGFYDAAIDFKPNRESAEPCTGAYGSFDEIRDIYATMYSLYLVLDEQIFIGSYVAAYAHPLEPIKLIKEAYQNVNDDVEILKKLNNKYEKRNLPIYWTLENYDKTATVLSYVLNLQEITDEDSDSRQSRLQTKLVNSELENRLRKISLKYFFRLLTYIMALLVPVFLIIKYRDNDVFLKWIGLLFTLYPVLSWIFSKEQFVESFKFCFSGRYRKEFEEKLRLVIENELN